MVVENTLSSLSKSNIPSIRDSLGEEWYKQIGSEFNKPYMDRLNEYLTYRRSITEVLPKKELVFRAFKETPFDKVRVCIIGKEPFPGPYMPDGLAFSTNSHLMSGCSLEMSKTIRKDFKYESKKAWICDLTRWTHQGVLLLNSRLTVERSRPNAHKEHGWERFILEVIRVLDNRNPNDFTDVQFLLWGKEAEFFRDFIKDSRFIFCESPEDAYWKSRPWDNQDCFNRVNNLLKTNKINW